MPMRKIMDLGQVKPCVRLLLIPEDNEPVGYLFVIQEGELVLPDRHSAIDAGMIIQLVIAAKTARIQQLIHHLTALAAK